jgi:hypothetical protein
MFDCHSSSPLVKQSDANPVTGDLQPKNGLSIFTAASSKMGSGVALGGNPFK